MSERPENKIFQISYPIIVGTILFASFIVWLVKPYEQNT